MKGKNKKQEKSERDWLERARKKEGQEEHSGHGAGEEQLLALMLIRQWIMVFEDEYKLSRLGN